MGQLTLLSTAQQALREIGVSAIPPSLLNGSTDANQVLAFIFAESRFLRNQYIFPQSKKSYEITLEGNRKRYPLPYDYQTSLLGTVWDDDNRWQLVGPLSDAEWVRLTKGFVSVGTRTSYRVTGSDGNQNTAGGQFEIYPAGPANATLSFEYQSLNLFRPPYWAPSTAYLSTVPSYVSSNGNIYVCTTSGTSGSEPIEGTGTGIVDGTAVWSRYDQTFETVLLDTHFSVFDDDIMISGIKWRYEKSKGVAMDIDPSTGVPVIHKKLIESSLGRFSGDYTVSLAGAYRYPAVGIPDGGWSL